MTLDTYQLRDFQEPGYKQLVTNFRHLLLFDPGLGKTPTCTKAMYDLGLRNILILCPKNAIRVWENHICEWFDGLDVATGKVTPETETVFHIWRWRKKQQDATQRQLLWRSKDQSAKVNIWICTYGAFVRDVDHFVHDYDLVILDEAKRIGRKRDGKTIKALQAICNPTQKSKRKRVKCVWPLTGTPGHRPEHFWNMFHLIDPVTFSSYWRYMDAFYTSIDVFGRKEYVAFKNMDTWKDLLRRKTSRVTKAEIGHRETIRAVKYAELSKDQERLYKQYEEDMYAVLEDRIDIVSTSLTQTLRYRQLLVCPKIIDPSLDIGGALEDLVEAFKEEEHNPQCVIFTPFTDSFPHFTRYLEEQGYPGVQVLQGGLDPDEQMRRIDVWRKGRVPIICSIMYAQAFSLEPAQEAFFIGREWDPDDNKQAEERLNRLTTPHAVTAYYYLYEGTYDERQFQILDTKTRQGRTIQRKASD